MVYENPKSATAKPCPDEPGTLGEQLTTLIVALYLGERRGTPAATQWQEARARCIPHAQKVVE